jgi:hypothetical protein
MADGTEKRCDEIRAGDIACAPGSTAVFVIAKVIKMHVPYADIVRLSGPHRPAGAQANTEGGFTPWHPVFPSETAKVPGYKELGWIHPADIGQVERVQTDAVYNFVLQYSAYDGPETPVAEISEFGRRDDYGSESRPGVLVVDGLIACTLGHDMQGPVISHPYFGQKEAGKRNIIEDLQALPDWADGNIVISNGTFHNDPATGIICGLTVE